MNIKHKLTCAFAVIAGLPIALVSVLVILSLRDEAREHFLDSSSREIQQVGNAMNLFFQGITQNVEGLALQPEVTTTGTNLNKYQAAHTESVPLGEQDQRVMDMVDRLGRSHPDYAYVSYGVAAVTYTHHRAHET